MSKCRFWTLLCTCSIKADPSPSCVYARLRRSAASMAALTFSLASSETKRVPLATAEKLKNKRDLSTLDRVVWDVLLWRHTRHLWSPLHLLCICESLSAHSSFLSRPRRAAGWWLCGESANTGPAWQTSHLCVCMGTSGPPRLAGPSVCLPVRPWAYTYCCCVLVLSCHQNFHSYTGAGLIYKNKPAQSKAKKPNVKEQPQHHFTVIWLLI